jgi:hypothetical protein
MDESKVKAIAEAKLKDYLQDMVIKSLFENTNDPIAKANDLRNEAIANCNCDDKTVDDYDKIQEAIQTEAIKFFDTLIKKLDQKTEDF